MLSYKSVYTVLYTLNQLQYTFLHKGQTISKLININNINLRKDFTLVRSVHNILHEKQCIDNTKNLTNVTKQTKAN